MAEALLTASEIAQHLKLHVETIYRLINQRGLPAVKLGSQWRFRVSEVDQWLYANGRQTDSVSTGTLQTLDDSD